MLPVAAATASATRLAAAARHCAGCAAEVGDGTESRLPAVPPSLPVVPPWCHHGAAVYAGSGIWWYRN